MVITKTISNSKHHHAIVELLATITVSLIYASGIGRYRIVFVYAIYNLINTVMTIIVPGYKVRFILLPATLVALYYDIEAGPLWPVYTRNSLVVALILMIVADYIVRKYTKMLIEKKSKGQMFVVCPSCKFDNTELVDKCKYCSYEKGGPLSRTVSEPLKIHKSIPFKVLAMLGLKDDEMILFHMKVFPFNAIIINGIREIRTYFVITTANIIFLDYLYFSKSFREKDIVPIQSIVSVEGKMKIIYLAEMPFLEILTATGDVYEILFKKHGKYKKTIAAISDIISKTNAQVRIDVDTLLNQ